MAAGGKLKVRGSSPAKEDSFAALVGRTSEKYVEAAVEHTPGDEEKQYSMSTFGAQFAEVAIDPDLGLLKVNRFVGAYSGGRILNAKTAHSQMVGGITFGIGMALMEQSIMDHNTNRYVNNSFGVSTTCLSTQRSSQPGFDAFFVDEEDPHMQTRWVQKA